MEYYTTFGLLAVVSYLAFRWRRNQLYAFAAKLEWIAEHPITGIPIELIGKSTGEVTEFISNLCSKFQEVGRLWFGPTLVVVLKRPDDIKAILSSTTCADKPYFFKFFDCPKGLFAASADVGSLHRNLLNSSLDLEILKSFVSIFNRKSEILTHELRSKVNAGQFNLYEFIGRCTLDTLVATTLGANLNFQTNPVSGEQYMKYFRIYMEQTSRRIFNPFLHFDFIYKRTLSYRKFLEAKVFISALSKRMVDFKRNESAIDLNNNDGCNVLMKEDEKHPPPQIYINQLFQLSQKAPSIFDNEAIKDEISTMLAAGHESTAFTVSNTLLMLAIHQDIQDRILAELEEVVSTINNDQIDCDILSKMTYTEMVVNETLRLFPVTPFILRHTTKDEKLYSQNLVVPKGVHVLIPVYSIHTDPKIWGENAEKFNPDNFSIENSKTRPSHAFIPFSAGPRNCFGQKYAMILIKIVVIHLLRKYRFRTTIAMNRIVKKLNITMKLAHEHLVSIEER